MVGMAGIVVTCFAGGGKRFQFLILLCDLKRLASASSEHDSSRCSSLITGSRRSSPFSRALFARTSDQSGKLSSCLSNQAHHTSFSFREEHRVGQKVRRSGSHTLHPQACVFPNNPLFMNTLHLGILSIPILQSLEATASPNSSIQLGSSTQNVAPPPHT